MCVARSVYRLVWERAAETGRFSPQSLHPCCPCSSSGPVKQQDGGDGNVITPPQPINIDWVVRFYPRAVKSGVRAQRSVSHIWALINQDGRREPGWLEMGWGGGVVFNWSAGSLVECASGQHAVIPKCDRLASSGSGIECV